MGVVNTNPYETPRAEQVEGRTNMRCTPARPADSGAWIGLLAVVIAIAIAVWIGRRSLWVKIVFIPITGYLGILIASPVFVSGIANPITIRPVV